MLWHKLNIHSLAICLILHAGSSLAQEQQLTLTSPAFGDMQQLPPQYTQTFTQRSITLPPGEINAALSPPLAWDNVPPGTNAFVLLVIDHVENLMWSVVNIPGDVRSLPEGIPNGNHSTKLPQGAFHRSYRSNGWIGPAAGTELSGRWRYYFTLYPLDQRIPVAADATLEEVMMAMEGHLTGNKAVMTSWCCDSAPDAVSATDAITTGVTTGPGYPRQAVIVSPAFKGYTPLPLKYAPNAQEMVTFDAISPPLAWTAPLPDSGTRSIAVTMTDMEASTGGYPQNQMLWAVINMPPNTRFLAENTERGSTPMLPEGAYQRSYLTNGYIGPLPGADTHSHHYLFEVYMLDTVLDLPRDFTFSQFKTAIEGHQTQQRGILITTCCVESE